MAENYEIKDNTGTLFKNENPKSDKSAPYTGSAKIDGIEYFCNAWINESKTGKKYFKLSFKAKENVSAENNIIIKESQIKLDDELPF